MDRRCQRPWRRPVGIGAAFPEGGPGRGPRTCCVASGPHFPLPGAWLSCRAVSVNDDAGRRRTAHSFNFSQNWPSPIFPRGAPRTGMEESLPRGRGAWKRAPCRLRKNTGAALSQAPLTRTGKKRPRYQCSSPRSRDGPAKFDKEERGGTSRWCPRGRAAWSLQGHLQRGNMGWHFG